MLRDCDTSEFENLKKENESITKIFIQQRNSFKDQEILIKEYNKLKKNIPPCYSKDLQQ